METYNVKLSQVKVNGDNPRTITTAKFGKLIDSVLVFPHMLAIRPIVVDAGMMALGGNMRCNALKSISKMGIEEITDRMQGISDFMEKTQTEQKNLVAYWSDWIENPTAIVIIAKDLSESERKQFIIKDNASFGQWDYDDLANSWNSEKLNDWGIDVWNAMPDPTEESHNSEEREDDKIANEEIDECDRSKKIEITIPSKLSDKADAIKEIIANSLIGYEDIKIK